jgi:hypothetical protein
VTAAAAVLLALVAAAGGSASGTAGPLPNSELVRRTLDELSARTGRRVQPPSVIAASAEERRSLLFKQWRAGAPWTADPRARMVLLHLGLLDPDDAAHRAVVRLVADDPGAVAAPDAPRLLVPEEKELAILRGDDPLLDAVGLTSAELRATAEIARSWAYRRLRDQTDDPDAVAARWSLAEGYARLCTTDRLLRASGVAAEDAGAALISAVPSVALPPMPEGAAEDLPEILAIHLVDGPDEALRLLVQRLLAGGWAEVEAVLDRPPPGTAALDPGWTPGKSGLPALPPVEEGRRRVARLGLGPRHLRLLLRSCGLARPEAEALGRDLLADRAALDRGRDTSFVWALGFRGEDAARGFAAAWPRCLDRRHGGGVEAAEEPARWLWPGGESRLEVAGAAVVVRETVASTAGGGSPEESGE